MYSSTIVGYVHGYGKEQCWNWAMSLKAHYTGDVVVIASNIINETYEWFKSLGFTVYTHVAEPHTAPVVTRFLYLWKLIEMGKIKTDYVMMSDVKDVVFQADLSKWFNESDNWAQGTFGCENVTYEDEAWGRDNLIRSFPHEYERLKGCEILNAGTFSASRTLMERICKMVYLLSVHNPIKNPDQAALNVLVQSGLLDDWNIDEATIDMPYAIQIGTTFDPTKKLKQIIPLDGIGWDENGIVNNNRIPYYIVHQYDRNPTLKALIDKRFTTA